MEGLLKFIIKELATEDFEVDVAQQGDKLNYTIKVKEDVAGLIIGKKGQTIKAIRNLMKVRAVLEKKVVNVNVEGKEQHS